MFGADRVVRAEEFFSFAKSFLRAVSQTVRDTILGRRGVVFLGMIAPAFFAAKERFYTVLWQCA